MTPESDRGRVTAKHFADWEGHAFGFGYGTGEEHTIAALKTFMAHVGRKDAAHAYDHEVLSAALTPTVAWLLINALCRHGVAVIEYGTSPRYGWLTSEGLILKAFIDGHTVDQLCEMTVRDEAAYICYPDACNCGPDGYDPKRKCPNPLWPGRRSLMDKGRGE